MLRVVRQPAQVQIVSQGGLAETYDKVILACHADQALRLLDSPTQDEQEILGKFRYQPNRATLHQDPSVMPRSRRAWASWNYRMEPAQPPAPSGGQAVHAPRQLEGQSP